MTAVAGRTPVVSKRRCSDASLFTGHVRSERYAAETHGQFMLENRGLTFGTPAKKCRREIVAPSSRNSIIIDNEGYMFEVDESTGSPKGPGLPPAAAHRLLI